MASYLLLQTGHLRETVQGLMVAQSLKRQRPDARIIWVGRDQFAALARVCTSVDVTLTFPRDGGVLGFFRTVREIRSEAAETGVDLQGLLRTGLLLRFSGANARIGRRDYRELAGLFYQRRPELPPAGSRSHGADIARHFLGALGLENTFTWPLEFGPPREFNSGLEPLGALVRPIVIFPEARRRNRRWNGFSELTNFILLNEPRARVVWAGAEAHEARESWRGPRFLNLTGRTSLDALPQVIRAASIVVSGDNGAAELAAALGRPTLTIYGPTDSTRSGPPSDGPANRREVRAPLAELARLPAREVWEALRAHPDWKP